MRNLSTYSKQSLPYVLHTWPQNNTFHKRRKIQCRCRLRKPRSRHVGSSVRSAHQVRHSRT